MDVGYQAEVTVDQTTSRMQDAVRLLLLIASAAEPLDDEARTAAPPGAVAVLRTQVALQKLDFWLRNPDYLAGELLDRYEASGDTDLFDQAKSIVDSEEPEVRRYPMLRYRFGAYERIDSALAVLASSGLVRRRREGDRRRTRQHNYYLTARGREVADSVVSDVPELRWYVDRVDLLVRMTTGSSGTDLKDMQYRQAEYVGTPFNSHIGAITERVRERLAELGTRTGES